VNQFIDHLQVVSTYNCYTIADLYTTNHATLSLLSLLPLVFTHNGSPQWLFLCNVFNRHFLVTSLSDEDSSVSVARWLRLHSWSLNSFVLPCILCVPSYTSVLSLSLSLSLMLLPTVSLSVCLWMKHQHGAYDEIFYYRQAVAGLLLWGAISDERKGLSFTIAGPRQRSHSSVRVPWDLRPYFIVSISILLFSSPPTILGATVEVFDPAFTL
jgi:hypothetical protein